MSDFFYTFIPIFVAMDVAGLIPVFLTLTQGLSDKERSRVSWQAVITAFVISLVFIAAGQWVFEILGISIADFMIAGGILLLVLGIVEMLNLGPHKLAPNAHAGPVPLGTPLIAGPAVLTSLMILIGLRGYTMTLIALLINLLLVMLAFRQSHRLVQWMDRNGLRALSQVVSLFLAAIAVNLIHRGFQALH